MKTYTVTCTRTVVIELEAENAEQAEEMASEMDWDDYPIEICIEAYEVEA